MESGGQSPTVAVPSPTCWWELPSDAAAFESPHASVSDGPPPMPARACRWMERVRVCSVFPGKSHSADEARTAEFKTMPAGIWGELALLQVGMLFVMEVAHRRPETQ